MIIKKNIKAEITVFISLIFGICLTLILNVILATSIRCSREISKLVAIQTIKSVFSEYEKDILEIYDLFLIDGGYKNEYDQEKIINRFKFYNDENLKVNNKLEIGKFYGLSYESSHVNGLELVCDYSYSNLKNQIVTYSKNKLGNGWAGILNSNTVSLNEIIDINNGYKTDVQNIDNAINKSSEDEKKIINTTLASYSDEIKKKDVLDLILGKDFNISNKQVKDYDFFAKRDKYKGYGDVRTFGVNDILSHIAISKYIVDHFSYCSEKKEESFYDYEIEYILGGMENDKDNLKKVIGKLLLIREGINYTYLASSAKKQAEVELLSGAISVAFPYLQPLIKQVVLFSWAYLESVSDIRKLLNGKKVALMKNDFNWQTSINNLKNASLPENNNDDESGVDYKEYLRILLLLSSDKDLIERMLDLVEININKIRGNFSFKIDGCIVGINIDQVFVFDRNIYNRFNTQYFYK